VTVYVYRNGQLVEKHLAPPLVTGDAAPSVISDTMESLRHMASGRYFSSKAAFRAETKAYGCTEVGNDQSVLRPRKPIPLSRERRRDDIRRTLYELRNGRSNA
jgi:hypothetical protein